MTLHSTAAADAGSGEPEIPAVPSQAPAVDPVNQPGSTSEDVRLSEHERVRVVLLPTTVTTRRGKPVRGLALADFQLFEEDEPQPITFFATEEDLPISLAFLLDVSGSMDLGGRLEDSKRVIRAFVEMLAPEDRAGLICFADEQVAVVTEFTTDRVRFLQRLDVQEALGPTALYDALGASPGLVDERIRGRRAIVLLTDGLDNASRLSTLEAVWLARKVRVPIYTLNFVAQERSQLPKRVRQGLRVLERFSSETGGAIYPVHRPEELQEAVGQIAAELKFQYVIGYHPAAPRREGQFRRIRLEMADRRNLRIRTRSGYYANP